MKKVMMKTINISLMGNKEKASRTFQKLTQSLKWHNHSKTSKDLGEAV
jgi:hypothetical protein